MRTSVGVLGDRARSAGASPQQRQAERACQRGNEQAGDISAAVRHGQHLPPGEDDRGGEDNPSDREGDAGGRAHRRNVLGLPSRFGAARPGVIAPKPCTRSGTGRFAAFRWWARRRLPLYAGMPLPGTYMV